MVEYIFDPDHSLIITEKRFNKNEHRDIAKNYLSIDGKAAWGLAPGEEPFSETVSFKAILFGKMYELDVASFYNAWIWQPRHVIEKGSLAASPGSTPMLKFYCFSKDNCRVEGAFSGEAGGFMASWKIQGGTSTRISVESAH